MKADMTMAMKAVGVSLAVGTAAAMAVGAVKGGSTKRKARRVAKKAINTMDGVLNTVQHFTK